MPKHPHSRVFLLDKRGRTQLGTTECIRVGAAPPGSGISRNCIDANTFRRLLRDIIASVRADGEITGSGYGGRANGIGQ
jgi:hypothetical protein